MLSMRSQTCLATIQEARYKAMTRTRAVLSLADFADGGRGDIPKDSQPMGTGKYEGDCRGRQSSMSSHMMVLVRALLCHQLSTL